MKNVSKGTQMMPPLAHNVLKGHYSRTVKVKLPKNELKLSLEVIKHYLHMSLNSVKTNLS